MNLVLVATVPHFPHELPLNVVADPDAPEAIDAARHVDVDVGVRVVDLCGVCRSLEFALEAMFVQVAREGVLFRPSQRFRWMSMC